MKNKEMNRKGFTLIEMMISLTILGVVLAGVYSAYVTQIKYTTQEYKVAQAEMEFGIAKNLIERDIAMGGFGLADNYSAVPAFAPKAAVATNGPPDTLTMTGTALGIESREAQEWTYLSMGWASALQIGAGPPIAPSFGTWGDGREDLAVDHWVILMEPSTKSLIANATGAWKFQYKGPGVNFSPALATLQTGTVVYGVSADATRPYATVEYSVGDAVNAPTPASCATGAQSLLRAEYWTAAPVDANIIPVQTCVLDFQVAFGLDTDENGNIDLWDNGGQAAAGYDNKSLMKRVRQVRLYILAQTANQDDNYTYPAATIRVGDALLGAGRDFTLTAVQRKFHWKVISITGTPRNMR